MQEVEKWINHYLEETLTPEEETKLTEWVLASAKNQILFEEAIQKHAYSPSPVFNSSNAFDTFKKETQKTKNTWMQRLQYAAVFVGVVVLGGMSYWMYNKKTNTSTVQHHSQEDIHLTSGENTHYLVENENFSLSNNMGDIMAQINGHTLKYSANANLQNHLQHIWVPFGKTLHICLPDGSSVWLNSGSSLQFGDQFKKDKRKVFLSGEAYFEVKSDSLAPFVVETSFTNAEVLGTAFNIKAYEEERHVVTTLKEGKIQLKANHSKQWSAIMTPMQQTVFDKPLKQWSSTQVQAEDFIAWTQNQLIFKGNSFEDIRKTLERRFDVQIHNNNIALKAAIYKGTFSPDNSLTDILNTIAISTPFEYKREDNQIHIW
ncbi:MAG: FecR family protein [Flavobacteriaceae bacterium]|nr:FecR family protein [Flavobacteriaceae bacterium]